MGMKQIIGRWTVKRFVLLCALALSTLNCAHLGGKSQEGKTDPYSRQVNVVYDEIHGTGLLADVFVPAGKPNGLGIIDVV